MPERKQNSSKTRIANQEKIEQWDWKNYFKNSVLSIHDTEFHPILWKIQILVNNQKIFIYFSGTIEKNIYSRCENTFNYLKKILMLWHLYIS